MQTSILVLPVLASICFGAAIPKPQELGSATTVSDRPHATYTLVVPCFGISVCVPKTLTIEARDDPAFTIPAFDLPSVSRVSAENTLLRREPEPQVIVTASRTVIVGPTPPASTSTKKTTSSTKKSTSTRKSTSSSKKSTTSPTKKPSSTIINSTKGQGSRTVTIGARQTLGAPSRTVNEWPWTWPTWTPPVTYITVTVTITPSSTSTSTPASTEPIPTSRVTSAGDGTTRTVSTTLAVPLDKRQALGSPSRTVNEWPWTWPTPTTKTEIVTVTVTYVPPRTTTTIQTTTFPSSGIDSTTRATEVDDGSTRTASVTLGVPKQKRQTLLEPTRTDLVVPTTIVLPTTIISSVYITTTKIITRTIPTTIGTTSISSTTVRLPTTLTKSISITSTETDTITTTTCTESIPSTTPNTSPATSRSSTTGDGSSRTVSTTLGVPIKGRQELGGGGYTYSVSWNGDGTGVPYVTQSVHLGKRQELGQPSRSFTFDGTVPVATETSVGVLREM